MTTIVILCIYLIIVLLCMSLFKGSHYEDRNSKKVIDRDYLEFIESEKKRKEMVILKKKGRR